MDTGLDKDQSELGVLVLSVGVHMLLDGNSLLDKHVKILRDGRGKAVLLKDAEDLVAGDSLDLCDTVGITKDHTDLGRGKTLLGELAHVLLDLCRGSLDP